MKQLKNYLSILSMLVALMLLTITSCTPDTEKEDLICKVSVEISEGGIGVVSNSEVVSGEEVTLKAVPEDTYRFVNWTVNGKEVSKENPYTTTITATTQFKANFEKDNYTLKITAGEGGVVKASQEGIVLNGTKVTLTATPNEGYGFVNWTVNGEEVSTSATYTVTVTKDVEYIANFITHKVTVTAGEGGTATANKTQVGYNGQVTLTATPNDGYSFVNWTVNGEEVSTSATYTVTVTKDVEYVANFITHKVTVIAGEGGTATASKNQVGHNGQVTLTATPQEGYSFVNWTVNGEEVSKEATYTITVTKDVEYVANFVTHKITVIAGEGGTATASKNQVGHNGQVTLTATPQEGYGFVNWTVNGKEISTSATYTATITADTEFKANFISYKVTVVSGEGGTAETSKTQAGHNEQVTLTATPNAGYEFVNWTVNGKEVSTSATYTATITADTEFKANFKESKENGHVYVDLGLPSGIKWATCNVGATTPEGYGDYFAWGETEPKDYYDWSTYKWCNGTERTMTKYCTNSYFGTVDNKTTLELTDDAARVNWGGNWRMPTKTEQDELRNTSNCTWTWTTQNGVNGYKVTSKKNGNSIFLPAAGCRDYGNLNNAGGGGDYWSSSLYTYGNYSTCHVYFYSVYVDWGSGSRCSGQSVRAVCE